MSAATTVYAGCATVVQGVGVPSVVTAWITPSPIPACNPVGGDNQNGVQFTFAVEPVAESTLTITCPVVTETSTYCDENILPTPTPTATITTSKSKPTSTSKSKPTSTSKSTTTPSSSSAAPVSTASRSIALPISTTPTSALPTSSPQTTAQPTSSSQTSALPPSSSQTSAAELAISRHLLRAGMIWLAVTALILV